MRNRFHLLIAATFTVALAIAAAPPRPQAPCDIYGAAGTPCVAAHSTTRALYAAYNGPLYQVKRQSDGKTLDIGIVPPSESPVPDPGGYANAAAQDTFCANTLCVINLIYDQSPKANHLLQGPPGPNFPGPNKGAFDTQPIADMAPITIGGHKVYGVFIMPGMGLRNNNASGLAIADEPEGIYYVVDGTHYDSGCCFDYGNSSTNGRAVGTGTMETTYFGTSTGWGRGDGPGPWIMADLEAGLFSGYDAKLNATDPTITWRFVTAVVDGGGGNKWDIRGGDAQKGGLTTFYNGVRPGSKTNAAYFPMHKQGGILLGTGGDNGNGSSGTFFEGVMTTGYPTEATTDALQANIVAAKYDVQRIGLSRVTTFNPKSSQDVTATFTNTSGAPVSGLKLSVSLPTGWTAAVSGGSGASKTFTTSIAPGETATATFKITSATAAGAGFLTGKADWTDPATRKPTSDTSLQRLRNALPVKINEVRFASAGNPTGQFIELHNPSTGIIDMSNWSLTHTAAQWAPVKLATIPAGTKIAPGGFYLLGLATSGLAAPSAAGATNILVRSLAGLEAGQQVNVDGETRKVASVGTAAAPLTTVFIALSTGPWLKIPAGATNLPVTNATGFEVGQKIGIDVGGNYEVATVTAVGKAGTQTTLAAAVTAGATNIKVVANANMSVGETLTIGTGARMETATVKSVGTPSATGTGVELNSALKFDHAATIDVWGQGTGITFTPATKFPHTSGDAVQALGSGVTLDSALTKAHAWGAPVANTAFTGAGFQGPPAPNQWFGGVLSGRAGSIALTDSTGALVVDAVVYGSQQSNSSANGYITSPELATLEGVQGAGGCMAIVPTLPNGPGGVAAAPPATNRSIGRFPDGRDTDSLCNDFYLQPGTTISAAAAAGATNIKVASVADFAPGQTIALDTGANLEAVVIGTVGTAGASTVATATEAGATVIPVAGQGGFTPGQTITIDSGGNVETATVVTAGGGRGGARINVAAPLTKAHAAGAQVSGSGITLSAPLTKAHAAGAQVASDLPTPGAANKYHVKAK